MSWINVNDCQYFRQKNPQQIISFTFRHLMTSRQSHSLRVRVCVHACVRASINILTLKGDAKATASRGVGKVPPVSWNSRRGKKKKKKEKGAEKSGRFMVAKQNIRAVKMQRLFSPCFGLSDEKKSPLWPLALIPKSISEVEPFNILAFTRCHAIIRNASSGVCVRVCTRAPNHPVLKQWGGSRWRQSRCEATDKEIYLYWRKCSAKRLALACSFALISPEWLAIARGD